MNKEFRNREQHCVTALLKAVKSTWWYDVNYRVMDDVSGGMEMSRYDSVTSYSYKAVREDGYGDIIDRWMFDFIKANLSPEATIVTVERCLKGTKTKVVIDWSRFTDADILFVNRVFKFAQNFKADTPEVRLSRNKKRGIEINVKYPNQEWEKMNTVIDGGKFELIRRGIWVELFGI